MRIAQQHLIKAIEDLDPAQNGLVTSLSIGLSTGFIVYTDNVTVGQVMIEATQFDRHEQRHYFSKEEVVHLQAVFDEKECAKHDVLPTFEEVLKWSRR